MKKFACKPETDLNEEPKLKITLGKFSVVVYAVVTVIRLPNSVVSALKRRFCRMLNKSNSNSRCSTESASPSLLLPRRKTLSLAHCALHRVRRGSEKNLKFK